MPTFLCTREHFNVSRALCHSSLSFDALPLLESHVHPKFVIYNAGTKLAGLLQECYAKLVEDFPSLASVYTLCNAWMQLPKQEELDNTSFKVLKPNDDNDNDDDDDDDDDDDGEYTNQTLSWQSFLGRQKQKWNAQASPTKSWQSQPKKQKVAVSPTNPHPKKWTQKTLTAYNVGEFDWTDHVQDWYLCF